MMELHCGSVVSLFTKQQVMQTLDLSSDDSNIDRVLGPQKTINFVNYTKNKKLPAPSAHGF